MTTFFKKILLFIIMICLAFLPSFSHATNTDYKIMNKPTATKQQIKEWAKKKDASDLYISLIDIGYDMAIKYEIDPTVMLVQTAVETNYGNFGGVINRSYYNTCGMKTTKGGGNYSKKAHKRFESWEEGFEAQAQHLRLYAGYCHHYREDCTHECPKMIDPRHFKEIGGRATHVSELSRVWATDNLYGEKINALCDEVVNTVINEENNKNTQTQIKEETIKEETKEEEINIIETIKAYIFKKNDDEKINYIKNLLLSNKKNGLSKKYIKEKINNKGE